MNTDTNTDTHATEPTNAAELSSFDVYATYCPEDNKLRLYCGRVSRSEYEALRAEGWKALHKQREAGGGDFVATWTPARRDTALRLCDVILDEDMGPAERAADRAERFAGYLDKRLTEATGHADRFDAGPSAHGYQSEARAERAAARHDKIAGRAVDAWDKAEYWQRRTAGVISHALHVSSPSVRMGRIKELESEIRKHEKSRAERDGVRSGWLKIAAETDAALQTAAALRWALSTSHLTYWERHQHPRRAEIKETHLSDLLRDVSDPITGAEAAALYLAAHPEQTAEGPWLTHFRLRLAYETAMLEAQGGRAGEVEIEVGGWLRGGRHLSNEERQIVKVNKSNATGRVVSVEVRDNRPSSVNHYGNPYPAGVTKTLVHKVNIERASPDCYRAPTDEDLAQFEAEKKADAKAKREAKKDAPPAPQLINPTDEDAERLQAVWNACRYHYSREPQVVLRITQAVYSANLKADRVKTYEIEVGGEQPCSNYDAENLPTVAKVRGAHGRVIVITDKPQAPFPATVWHDPRREMLAELEQHAETLEQAARASWSDDFKQHAEIIRRARICRIFYVSSMSQFGFSESGLVWLARIKAKRAEVVTA